MSPVQQLKKESLCQSVVSFGRGLCGAWEGHSFVIRVVYSAMLPLHIYVVKYSSAVCWLQALLDSPVLSSTNSTLFGSYDLLCVETFHPRSPAMKMLFWQSFRALWIWTPFSDMFTKGGFLTNLWGAGSSCRSTLIIFGFKLCVIGLFLFCFVEGGSIFNSFTCTRRTKSRIPVMRL